MPHGNSAPQTPAPAAPHADVPPIAPVPDLSDVTGMPEGPAPVTDPLRNIDPWDGAGMTAHLIACARRAANGAAQRAGRMQATGKGMREWHTSIHAAVLSTLAAAEQNAPEPDRPWHAARLDAYAAAYGLRGWYRYTDFRGKHAIQVNRIRTHLDGNHGRYYTTRHAPRGSVMNSGPYSHGVVDRDTQRQVYEAVSARIALQWIQEHEAA
ncbi:hypothetical protein OHA27_37920 [Streptomyces sp. NBC_01619]|uniref:hypothetical protein n=1 Tax=Streptomyces sp. NBC_01619 TaxID=2975901 RepID=UPI002257E2D9|nr:hypothetical protein [Streptomyces sp. NBC_01619]MCX4515899.1 hypothetical protein [Streptomyces sp. NBC_01619]